MLNERDQEAGTTDYRDDFFYPGTVTPETIVNTPHFGPFEDIIPYDPGIPTQQDTGGQPGHVFELVNAIHGGVDTWENFDLTGRVVRVPSSTEFYQEFHGPVGTRDMTDEVGLAVMVDHLETNPDPYWLREDIAGAV